MIYDRYYYSLLESGEKRAYKQIYSGIENHEKNIRINKILNLSVDFDKVLRYIGLDNPHLFYVDFSKYLYIDEPLFFEFELTYWYTPDEVKELNKKVSKVLNKMLAQVSGNTEAEKEKSVHDLLITNVLYDKSALTAPHRSVPRANTVLGVLFYKTAVCEGVAKVTKMLLNMLDIKCIVAIGTATANGLTDNHAWNIVKINGKAFQLDITWDLNATVTGRLCYDYFNLTDRQILSDHHPTEKYPPCTTPFIKPVFW